MRQPHWKNIASLDYCKKIKKKEVGQKNKRLFQSYIVASSIGQLLALYTLYCPPFIRKMCTVTGLLHSCNSLGPRTKCVNRMFLNLNSSEREIGKISFFQIRANWVLRKGRHWVNNWCCFFVVQSVLSAKRSGWLNKDAPLFQARNNSLGLGTTHITMWQTSQINKLFWLSEVGYAWLVLISLMLCNGGTLQQRWVIRTSQNVYLMSSGRCVMVQRTFCLLLSLFRDVPKDNIRTSQDFLLWSTPPILKGLPSKSVSLR